MALTAQVQVLAKLSSQLETAHLSVACPSLQQVLRSVQTFVREASSGKPMEEALSAPGSLGTNTLVRLAVTSCRRTRQRKRQRTGRDAHVGPDTINVPGDLQERHQLELEDIEPGSEVRQSSWPWLSQQDKVGCVTLTLQVPRVLFYSSCIILLTWTTAHVILFVPCLYN